LSTLLGRHHCQHFRCHAEKELITYSYWWTRPKSSGSLMRRGPARIFPAHDRKSRCCASGVQGIGRAPHGQAGRLARSTLPGGLRAVASASRSRCRGSRVRPTSASNNNR
jgi:hypothetical protein